MRARFERRTGARAQDRYHVRGSLKRERPRLYDRLVDRLLERDAELEALVGAVVDAQRGGGAFVLVGGEAGSGKSSLIRALRERVAGQVTFLAAGCEFL